MSVFRRQENSDRAPVMGGRRYAGPLARRAAPVAAMLGLLAAPAAIAQPEVTVTSLIEQGYVVVTSFMNPNIGPVLFLQNGASLVMCVVQEMPDTPTLTTLYCKAVE